MAKKKKQKLTKKKNNSQKVSQKKVNISKLRRGIVIAALILVIILLLLILTNVGVFDKPAEEQLFSIQDECSIVMGNLIHQIRDEGDCKIKCLNDCEIRALDFVQSEFIAQETGCHACNCYCE